MASLRCAAQSDDAAERASTPIDERLEAAKRATESAVDPARAGYELGLLYVESGDLGGARDAFRLSDQSSKRRVLSRDARYNIGVASMLLAAPNESQSSAQPGSHPTSADSPPSPEQLLKESLKHLKGAESAFRAALDADPKDKNAAINLELTRRAIKRAKDQLKELERQREEKRQQQQEQQQQMNDAADQLDDMADRQDELSEQSRDGSKPSEEISEEQQSLKDAIEKMRQELEQMDKESDDAETSQPREKLKEAIEKQKEALERLEEQQRDSASESQSQAAEKLREAAKQLREAAKQEQQEQQQDSDQDQQQSPADDQQGEQRPGEQQPKDKLVEDQLERERRRQIEQGRRPMYLIRPVPVEKDW